MELSSDLIEEILSWVPARSLPRLKHTCKHWQTLISEPSFIKKHLSHMRGRDQQFSVFNYLSSSQVSYSLLSTIPCVGIEFNELDEPCLDIQVFDPLPSTKSLVHNMYHCDGLLLLVMSPKLLVLNPLLKQGRWVQCGYGCDHSLDAYGLGYISSSYEYKMVRFRCGASDKNSRIDVYEFKSDTWRVVVDKGFQGFSELPKSSVCLRGTPYWIGCQNGKTFSTIQSFDFSKERFEHLFLPPSSIGSSSFGNYVSLGVFRGDKLSLLHKSGLTGKIQIWVMKKHWSKLMIVDIPEFVMLPRYSSYYIDNDGKLVLSVHDIKSIKIYIVRKNDECQNVEYSDSHTSICFSVCYYVPTLLQVPGFSKREDF